ncbi:MAG TPA: TonB-dependent receptor, partial [Rhodothermales bacterium]|nr:TonB-dependent receptor [Rhodothermales bacterium]
MLRPLLLALLLVGPVAAQTVPDTVRTAEDRAADSLRAVALDDVVVTATRTARALEDVPVPTTVLTRDEIAARGVRRLSDLLADQAGLVVVDGLGGAGLQVQGFDPDYTLILLDGEPVVGRTAGTLALDRLGVTTVERVEVVRGPLSARYGSDALAGVVNLVTRRPGGPPAGHVSARAESVGRTDLSAEAEAGTAQGGVRLALNRYAADGYSARPETGALTIPAFSDYSADLRAEVRPGAATTLSLRGRVAHQTQDGAFLLGDALYDEASDRTDWSVAPSVRHRFSRRLTGEVSGYAATFENASRSAARDDGALFDSTGFVHRYRKAEGGLTWLPAARHSLYAGGGVIAERVGGDRYASARTSSQPFGYAEYTWLPSPRFDVVLSGRFDAPSDFAARFTPSLALRARPLEWLSVRGSVGNGYKAPDFRQRYLTF